MLLPRKQRQRIMTYCIHQLQSWFTETWNYRCKINFSWVKMKWRWSLEEYGDYSLNFSECLRHWFYGIPAIMASTRRHNPRPSCDCDPYLTREEEEDRDFRGLRASQVFNQVKLRSIQEERRKTTIPMPITNFWASLLTPAWCQSSAAWEKENDESFQKTGLSLQY